MKTTFAKTVVIGASCAAGLLAQALAIASPAPSGSSRMNAAVTIMAQDQIRKRDQKKDGSCTVSEDQTRKRDQKKDGSCTS